MTLTRFNLKQNDRKPSMVATLRYENGTIRDLTGCTVKFLMRRARGWTAKVNAAATVTDAAGGVVRYDWASGDTDTVGRWQGEFQVTETATGKLETFPNVGYLAVVIADDIAD